MRITKKIYTIVLDHLSSDPKKTEIMKKDANIDDIRGQPSVADKSANIDLIDITKL